MNPETKSVCEQKNYEMIFNNHSETLRNFIYYKCGNLQQAEDIVQDSFIKLWKNCAKVIFEKAKSYLYTISKNAFLNEVAYQKVVLKHQVHLVKESTNETPEFILEEKEFMVKLKKAIADLPEKQREVFLLSRIDKKKYAEIAEVIGITVKAVEKRMSLALKTLREKIGDI
ncbi:RNA polymerase sigma-70 factor (ECF subfamily) [Lutibacter sp. Hel_I_33_5]|uniref:RNA polymerase sigma factor n=1 Tax=Lutibacter sp. Hel_I_33_5 TaxID=1566289 RepID=UPI0011A163DA|nr:sigma-70 family RNA polymerase sigma factor [Lutibacter sp. Hel_I_33_5]TVZ55994.1 RNA polymerase sigma-70 factor (ECF subfamily) [Lutibacter sp. Hel_I_33_5]